MTGSSITVSISMREGPTRLTSLLQTAIAKVKQDVGNWDEYEDEPDVSLQRAALRLAELMALKPEVLAAVTRGAIVGDPAYQSFLYGKRRVFGIA